MTSAEPAPALAPSSTVGLFHHLPEQQGPVVGRQVAVDDFVKALLRHGTRHRYALYCHGREREGTAAQIGAANERATVHDRRELQTGDLSFAAWHETQFDTYTPFALRARAPAPFPVTVVHHTLSYKELLHDSILRLLLAKAHRYDSVVCTSAAARRALETLIDHVAERFEGEHGVRLAYRGRFDLIPLAVDTDRYRPHDRAKARARFHIDGDAFVILWVGRLSVIDKADLVPLVQAFATLREANPGRKLRLVCAGTERPGERFGGAIADYAKHLGVGAEVRVITEGAVFMPQKEHLYAAADVFVSPVDNVQETFGLTPIEAMACGVPQVGSDWDGYRDTIVHGETGFLVPTIWARCQDDLSGGSLFTETSYDHLALAQSVAVDMGAVVAAVQRLLDEPALRDMMAAASRRRAEALYSWPAVIARYEALWADLAGEAHLRPEPQRDGASYATPDYGRVFGAYATRALDDGAVLCLTALGRKLVAGDATIPAHYVQQWQHVDLAIVKRVLAGLVQADQKGEGLGVGRIVAVMSRKAGDATARGVILRHALFLMKYGFAEVAPSAAG